MSAGDPVLEVADLRVRFHTDEGVAEAVDGVSFRVAAGETLGLVGESGCGKSVTALAILRLVDPPGEIDPASRIRLRGEDLLGAPARRMREVRGGEIGMVFQEPMTSLNPVYRVGEQVAEALRRHRGLSGREARREVVALLDRVGIPDPEGRRRQYPHELSGGLRQRVMIAMAISCRPAVLIADEPTTALDVTIQAQILELLASLQAEFGMALLLITHDLAVVSSVADRVAVMYAGQVVEEAPTAALFADPLHPYAEGLLRAVPDLDVPRARLAVIPGTVPPPTRWPPACRFHPRCPYAWDRCRREAPPPLRAAGGGAAADAAAAAASRRARCWLLEEPGRREEAGFDADPADGG